MSEKRNQKTIEELCDRSREIWPSLSQTSNHRLLRSPSPRESFSRSRRLSANALRHSLFSSRPTTTSDAYQGIPKQSSAYDGEKRSFFESGGKKTFFPGIQPQVVTHAEPPFPGTDTQPLPPINMPRTQAMTMQGTDNRPYTVVGQSQFEGCSTHDLVCAVNEERRGKRKLEAIKRGAYEGQAWTRTTRQYRDQDVSGHRHHGKKKCSDKKGRRARKFQRPLAWKSPWPDKDAYNGGS